MRKPTPYARSHAWHTATLAGLKPPITHEPQCGWFMRRLGKDAPPIPAIIYLEGPIDPATGDLLGPETMICEVNGQRRNPVDEWTWLAGRPISEQQYLDMMGDQLGELESESQIKTRTNRDSDSPVPKTPQNGISDIKQHGVDSTDEILTAAKTTQNDTLPAKPAGAKTIF